MNPDAPAHPTPAQPQVLERGGHRWLDVTTAVLVLVLVGITVWAPAPANRGILAACSLLLALVFVGMDVWVHRQAIVLADDELRGRLLPTRPRIPRDDVADVEVASAGLGTSITVVRRSGRRTALGLVSNRLEAERQVAAIRTWAGIAQSGPVLVVPDVVGDQQWTVAPRRDQVRLLWVLVALAVAVPVSLLWHAVAWWGWLSAVVLVAFTVRVARRVLITRTLTLTGDELVVEGRRRTAVRASTVRRVLTLAGEPHPRIVLDVDGREAVRVPSAADCNHRAALLQRWAENHGGGAGRDVDFVEPRNWLGVAELALGMASMMACPLAAVPGEPGELVTTAVLVGLFGLVQNLRRAPVVRDWSRH